MSAHSSCTRAHADRLLPLIRSVAPLAAAAIGVALAACSQTPRPLAGPDPSDSRSPVRMTAYRSVIGPYQSQRPAEPTPWREQNERIAPAPKP